MKSYSFLGVAVATLLVPLVSSAQYYQYLPREAGPYIYAGMGMAFTEDGEITEFTGFAAGNSISYNTGLAFEFGGGFAFNKYFAIGGETGWVGNEIDSVDGFIHDDTFFGSGPILATLTLQCPIPNTIITPFIRVAAGGAFTVFDTDGFSNGAVTLFGDDTDFVFAYQLAAGIRFDLNEQMSITATYKYFGTEDSEFEYESFFPAPDQHLGIEGVRSHLVTVSFNMRY